MNGKKVGIGIAVILLIAIVAVAVLFLLPKDEETFYKVTFNNEGVMEVVDVEAEHTVAKPIEPTKEGFIFDGWYYNGIKFDFTTEITQNITLEARWTAVGKKTWLVTFDTAGGNPIETLTVEDGKTVDTVPTPKKTGYTFVGWYYNNTKFDFKTTVTKNMTLTAKWEKVEEKEEQNEPAKPTKYTVKFDSAGGSAVPAQTVEKNKTVAKPNDPTRNGYTFIGWYLNGTHYNFNLEVTSNITLTAKWEKLAEIKYIIEEIPESYVGQVRIFVLKDNVKVDGIVDIVTTNGKVVTNKEIPKEGYVTNGSIVESITNVRAK